MGLEVDSEQIGHLLGSYATEVSEKFVVVFVEGRGWAVEFGE